jgi:hypothetical protein
LVQIAHAILNDNHGPVLEIPHPLILFPAFPAPVMGFSEPDCSEDYYLCLNSALQFEGIADELGSVECAAEWVGCTVAKLKFW